MRRTEVPPLDEDKILDAPPGLDVDALGGKDLGPLSPRQARPSRKTSRARGVWILVGFLLGVGVVGFLFWEFTPRQEVLARESPSRSLFAYPAEGIRLERRGLEQGEAQGPGTLMLSREQTLKVRYGKEAVRFLAIERDSSLWARVLTVFLTPPGLYLDQKALEPGQDLMALMAPEKSLHYELSLRSKPGAPPLATFNLELEMTAQSWAARARELKEPQAQRACLEQALRAEPGNVDILVALGQLLWEQNEPLAAAERFEEVLKHSPKHKEAAQFLASIYLKSKPKRALEMYGLLAEIDPQARLEHLKQVAQLQERLGISPAETYRKILAVQKNDPDARRGLDTLYAKQVEKAQEAEKKGDISRAIQQMKQALELHPSKEGKAYLATLHNNLAYSLAKQGKFKEAIPYYEASLKLDENPVTRLNLADAYSRTKQPEDALKSLEKAWSLKPKEEDVVKNILLLWAELLSQKQDHRGAIAKLQELHSRFPKDPEAAKMLAAAYWNQKELAKALEVLKGVPSLMGSHPPKAKAEIHAMLGDLYRALGDQEKNIKTRISRYDEALREYKAALALNKGDKQVQKKKEELESERMGLVKRSLRSP
jgi:tetratricopeptide (TPR) repeat protein